MSKPQSAFIKWQTILDEISISNEVVNEMNEKNKDVITSKVDFEKTYICLGGVGLP